jgi:2-keto-3-deoxy-L-rhamnonate aldolase RhmA
LKNQARDGEYPPRTQIIKFACKMAPMSSGDYQSELHALIARRKVLIGMGCDSGSPVAAELAGIIGFDVVWVDLEHGPANWMDAQTLCQAAKAGGAMSLLRIQSADRNHVMHALDVGGDVVVVPMVESRATSEDIVRHGKYMPIGKRGFAGSPRGLNYGWGDDKMELVRRMNRETHLFVQIETATALERCAEIVSVEGLTGALVGPSDLSFSLGKPLNFDADFVAKFAGAVRTIRAQGKIAATATGHPDLVKAGIEAGLQIIICGSEVISLRTDWARIVKSMKQTIGRAE